MNNELTNLQTFEAAKVKNIMTMQEIAEAMGVSKDTIRNCVRRIFPAKMQQGKTAYFDESEVACISKELKSNTHALSYQTSGVTSQVKDCIDMAQVAKVSYSLPDGTQRINLKTVVFQKGVDFICKVIKQNLK